MKMISSAKRNGTGGSLIALKDSASTDTVNRVCGPLRRAVRVSRFCWTLNRIHDGFAVEQG